MVEDAESAESLHELIPRKGGAAGIEGGHFRNAYSIAPPLGSIGFGSSGFGSLGFRASEFRA